MVWMDAQRAGQRIGQRDGGSLCRMAPATSSHARAEWARPTEYRVGPIIIAVRSRFGCHNALRWVPEQAESDVSGRSRRPTVPAECG